MLLSTQFATQCDSVRHGKHMPEHFDIDPVPAERNFKCCLLQKKLRVLELYYMI